MRPISRGEFEERVVSASWASRTADVRPASDVDQGSGKTVSDYFGERARFSGCRSRSAVLWDRSLAPQNSRALIVRTWPGLPVPHGAT